MGLMISASGGIIPVMSLEEYRALPYEKTVERHFIVIGGPVDDIYAAGLQGNTVYEAHEEQHHTFTIHYSGYTRWLNLLAEMAFGVNADEVRARAEEWRERPFFTLIAFDEEGAIGPIMSATIAADFAAQRDRAEQVREDWFLEVYDDFAQAFAVGAESGIVIFQ